MGIKDPDGFYPPNKEQSETTPISQRYLTWNRVLSELRVSTQEYEGQKQYHYQIRVGKSHYRQHVIPLEEFMALLEGVLTLHAVEKDLSEASKKELVKALMDSIKDFVKLEEINEEIKD